MTVISWNVYSAYRSIMYKPEVCCTQSYTMLLPVNDLPTQKWCV